MTLLDIFLGEFLGTMFLILLGNGVVANCIFKNTLGAKSGFLAITIGWGIAVFIGVFIANSFGTGGHLNPAVTTTLWVKGAITSGQAGVYYGSEFLGAGIGQLVVSAFYWNHIKEADNKNALISIHSTGPTHKKTLSNLLSEFVGTGVLVACALALTPSMMNGSPESKTFIDMKDIMRFAGPLSMGIVVLSIGISLGGTTGYAINPARDLAPRIVYALMPYKNKPANSANWSYSWIPVVAPLAAGVVVGAFGRLIS